MASNVSNIRFEDGILLADVDGNKTPFTRPCEISTLIGVKGFVLFPDCEDVSFTIHAQTAIECSNATFTPLRGELGEFLVFAVYNDDTFKICVVSRKSMTLTIRTEDAWEKLPKEKRFYSYSSKISHDNTLNQTVLHDIAPDARIFLDIADHGGFVAEFTPEKNHD